MNAANYDITIDRAADYSFYLTIVGGDGSAIDVSGDDFYAQIRHKDTKKPTITFTCTPSVSPVNEVLLALTTTQTKALIPDELPTDDPSYEWDLFMVRSGATTRLLYGDVAVRDNATSESPIE